MRLLACVLEELEKDRSLNSTQRCLYLLAWAHDPAGVAELAKLANVSRCTVTRACAKLVERGWIKLVRSRTQTRPAALIPRQSQMVMAHDLEVEYELEPRKGEFLMNKRLDWSLRSDEYVRNARPKFLANPETGMPLEFDRFDPKTGLACEYNGSQHYHESDDYTEEEVKRQRVHDLIKESLSLRNGVTLLVFSWQDLRPGTIESRLDAVVPHLKRGYVDMDGPYMKTLARMCGNYASRVEKAEREALQRRA